MAWKDIDFGVISSAHHLQFAGLGDLSSERDAPGAHDAPILVELDQLRHVLPGIDQPLLDEAVAGLAMMIAIILEAAFAGLVADGAVKRMVQEQVLHDHTLMFLDL